jgi:hypothetical protein
VIGDDPDVVLFLTTEIRAELTALADAAFPMSKGWVDGREWSSATDGGTAPKWQVIVRDDGIADSDLIVGDAAVGVSVLAGTKANPKTANDLARIVKRIVKATPRAEAGNPVASISSFLGPYPVDEASTYARRYMAATLTVVGNQS